VLDSQKYYKLLNKSSVKLGNGHPVLSATTPIKRKANTDDKVRKTPTRRPKKPVKEEDLDGELYSSVSSSPEQTELNFYPGYNVPFVSDNFAHYGTERQGAVKAEASVSFLL
jgi:hypothetical protein